MSSRRTTFFCSAALLWLGAAPALQAQDGCVPTLIRGPLEVTPVPGPFPVTLGAPIKVRYPPGYFDDPSIGADPDTAISLRRSDSGEVVPGTAQLIGDTVVFIADRPFAPRLRYEGRAEGVDRTLDIRFTTGVAFDTGPPELGDVLSMTASPVGASCDAPAGGYRIDVSFEPAVDDGPPGDIEYLLYVSRGPTVDAPELRARVRNLTPGEVIMAFVISPSEAVSPICVTVHAVDGVGNIDDDGAPFCDDPIKGNFFAPLCSVTPLALGAAGPSGAVSALCLALLILALVRLRRTR